MLGSNFLKMENYADYEGFTNKKEKFTADELNDIINEDNNDTVEENIIEQETLEEIVNDDIDNDIQEENNVLENEVSEESELMDTMDTSDNEMDNIKSEEGFMGSRMVNMLSMKSLLYLLMCILLTYLCIKAVSLNYGSKMKLVYTRINFLKLNKLNLDFDLVLSVFIGLLIYLVLLRFT